MKKILLAAVLFLLQHIVSAQQSSPHDLHFAALAKSWDEGIPLGNGMLGALVWQKENQLRFSLDRADLWDQRPMKGLHRKEFSYQWVIGQVMKKDYARVQQYFDDSYEQEPAPSKIPGGALEFSTQGWGDVQSVHLFLSSALCEVHWSAGVVLKTFVHAVQPLGWFRIENLPGEFSPEMIAPKYRTDTEKTVVNDLSRLGYQPGTTTHQPNSIMYVQQGWGGFSYAITVRWKKINNHTVEGVWSITSNDPGNKNTVQSTAITQAALKRSFAAGYVTHQAWWKNFWSKSAVHIPDTLLEKQWYLEQYKFGSASRRGAPPISLQAVWTADNGRLPPWKGDFHHDLNTQLSYWPCYSANHLEEGLAYLDHLDKNKDNYRRFTKLYFGKDGIAVPGVTTLNGTEMGGWVQYSLSPTTSSWLAQHYYLQWRYSMDKDFLKNRGYPWVKEVAAFVEHITVKDENGNRKLPISSSPEINDNDISAWFHQNTNYDLALMKFTFFNASEMAAALGLKAEAEHWKKIFAEFGDWALTANNELKIAPSLPYKESHRHLSPMMAIHPLGLIKWEDGAKAQTIIRNSIHLVDSIGPDWWCGYTYSWLANMKARAKDGNGAAKDLQLFARAFCLPNSFHVNGDQTKSGYSRFHYRPFTLEGNFAFAAGLQEMLLQSYAGFIEIMPAIPDEWKDVSFEQLRTEGAFLVNARKADGKMKQVTIVSEKGGTALLKSPFDKWTAAVKTNATIEDTHDGFIKIKYKPGGTVVLNSTAN